MFRRVVLLAVTASLLFGLGGCALNIFESARREAWRNPAEAACIATRPFRRDDYVTQVRAISDHGVCGLESPLIVTALLDGSVRVGPDATIGCPMAVTLEAWLSAAVQPAAIARLGSPVVAIRQMSSYSCRNVQNQPGNELSEHAFGNALDIGSFELADGRVVSVRDDWSRGTQAEQDFLRDVHYTACQYFRTVLGPGYPQHDDHFHLDLAHHNEAGTTSYCRPTPVLPPLRDPTFLPMANAGNGNATPIVYAAGNAAPIAAPPARPTNIGAMIQNLLR